MSSPGRRQVSQPRPQTLLRSPMSPFRTSSGDQDQMFRISLMDNEVNCSNTSAAVIPMQMPIHKSRGVNPRFYSQPTSPSSSSSLSRISSSVLSSSPLHSSSMQSSSGHGTPVKTVKHYEESLRAYKKENFNLKLKIFFLEERLAQNAGESDLSMMTANTDLKVQLETMKHDLNDKLNLLLEANDAIDILETKIKTQEKNHQQQIKDLQEKQEEKQEKSLKKKTASNKGWNILSDNNMSTESLVLEVLEELEEFSEREKDFENKYVKTMSQLKSEAEKTDSELTKIKDKMASYEEEIESLNCNLDRKSEFIVALQEEIKTKGQESNELIKQLDRSASRIRMMEKEVCGLRKGKRKNISNKNVGTDLETCDIIKLLEDEIMFKNQEIKELNKDFQSSKEKSDQLENVLFKVHRNVLNQNDVDSVWRRKLDDLTKCNNNLNDKLKMQTYERKLLLRKINSLNEKLSAQ